MESRSHRVFVSFAMVCHSRLLAVPFDYGGDVVGLWGGCITVSASRLVSIVFMILVALPLHADVDSSQDHASCIVCRSVADGYQSIYNYA